MKTSNKDSLFESRVLITGASRRLGAAIALGFAEHGAHIALHYRSDKALAESVKEVALQSGAASVLLLEEDLLAKQAAPRLIEQVVKSFGGLDHLILNAGNFPSCSIEKIDEESFEEGLALNLKANFFLAQAAIAPLRQSEGSIIGLGCASVKSPFHGYLPYVVGKAAFTQMLRTLALELAPQIRLNIIAPGTVMPAPNYSDERIASIASNLPMQRIGSPEDIVEAALFLARSRYTTGAELPIDGGRHLGTIVKNRPGDA